jgi:DNA invertase Pin-like site-specific DNA recombinase
MEKHYTSYLRVSTNSQGESGLGLEAQREAVRRFIESSGGSLVEEFVEVESGKISSRPILASAITNCRHTKSTLAIAKLDRLARSVAFISALMETDIEFVAVDMPHANRLVLHMMAAFAEFEREQISARTKAALAAAKARGVVLGRYGATLARQHKEEAASFAETMRGPIEHCLGNGSATLAEIAGNLNDAGHVTAEGARWGPTGVLRVLKRLHLRSAYMS